MLNDLLVAEKSGMLFHEWRGIHVFSRRLPKNYFESQIRALLLLRNQPVALQRWLHCKVRDAVWDSQRQIAKIELEKVGNEKGEITLDFKQMPQTIRFAGKPVEIPQKSGQLTLPVEKSALLEIAF